MTIRKFGKKQTNKQTRKKKERETSPRPPAKFEGWMGLFHKMICDINSVVFQVDHSYWSLSSSFTDKSTLQ